MHAVDNVNVCNDVRCKHTMLYNLWQYLALHWHINANLTLCACTYYVCDCPLFYREILEEIKTSIASIKTEHADFCPGLAIVQVSFKACLCSLMTTSAYDSVITATDLVLFILSICYCTAELLAVYMYQCYCLMLCY